MESRGKGWVKGREGEGRGKGRDYSSPLAVQLDFEKIQAVCTAAL